MKEQKLMAFWRYDLFPYFLSGEVESFVDRGKVYVRSFQGTFTPVLILPFDEGMKLKSQLEKMERNRMDDIKKIDSSYRRELAHMMSGYNVKL